MPLLETLAIGAGAVAAGSFAITRQKKQHPPAWLIDNQIVDKPAPRSLLTRFQDTQEDLRQQGKMLASSLYGQADGASQVFVQATVDRAINTIFGSMDREEHQHSLKIQNTTEPQAFERMVNRRITAGTVITGITIVGYYASVPLLYYSSIPLTALLLYGYVVDATRDAIKKRRLTFETFIIPFVGGMWLGGYLIASAAAGIIFPMVHKLVLRTHDHSQRNMRNIFGQQPRSVWMLVDGVEMEVPFDQIQAGDIVVVAAGQTIPVDGTIVQGAASIDQHMLTGESQPAEKGVDERVFAPTLVLSGRIHVRVEQAGEETTAMQIVRILNDTDSYNQQIDTRITRITDMLVLPIVLLSGGAWITVGAKGAIGMFGLGNIYMMKFVTPVSLLNFLNIAAQQGVLVKDARAFDVLDKVDTVVFDKTGTLTLEQPEVVKIHVCADYNEDEILRYAAASEQQQTHPIAQAILQAAAERDIPLPPLDDAEYELGYGLTVLIGDMQVQVGSTRFMQQEGIALPDAIEAVAEQAYRLGHSLVMVALNDRFAGAIELQPTIRPEARQVVEELQARGCDIYIISGDHETPTQALAQHLGIQHYFANTLPENKAQMIKQLQQEGKTVCFVGDGINDAVALKQANVSVSLRGATTLATDTAQIVLMDQRLDQLTNLFTLTRQVNTNLNVSLVGCIVPDVALLGGIFLLHWGIYAAYIAAIASIAFTMSNAMLPLMTHKLNGLNGKPELTDSNSS